MHSVGTRRAVSANFTKPKQDIPHPPAKNGLTKADQTVFRKFLQRIARRSKLVDEVAQNGSVGGGDRANFPSI